MMMIHELPPWGWGGESENGSSYATSSIGQRDAKDCLATFASSCTPGQPPRGGGGRGAAGGWGWGCGGRFSNNYIELRWWWVAMVTAVPSVSYDWKQPGNRAMQPGSLPSVRTLCVGPERFPGPFVFQRVRERWKGRSMDGFGRRSGFLRNFQPSPSFFFLLFSSSKRISLNDNLKRLVLFILPPPCNF